jgi:hypothetical protein
MPMPSRAKFYFLECLDVGVDLPTKSVPVGGICQTGAFCSFVIEGFLWDCTERVFLVVLNGAI